MKTTMTLEEFKAKAADIKAEICNRKDIIDIQNGRMTIYAEHLNKYLEEYCCKDEEDLSDTLYYRHGVFLKIVE